MCLQDNPVFYLLGEMIHKHQVNRWEHSSINYPDVKSFRPNQVETLVGFENSRQGGRLLQSHNRREFMLIHENAVCVEGYLQPGVQSFTLNKQMISF
mmetsp:Transcript_18285/g.31119  ORF Transcript_18285/g.31119 Transcript_18285/m.31119 type:complete len:97 (-) Transcript_18285:1967-2257(-)